MTLSPRSWVKHELRDGVSYRLYVIKQARRFPSQLCQQVRDCRLDLRIKIRRVSRKELSALVIDPSDRRDDIEAILETIIAGETSVIDQKVEPHEIRAALSELATAMIAGTSTTVGKTGRYRGAAVRDTIGWVLDNLPIGSWKIILGGIVFVFVLGVHVGCLRYQERVKSEQIEQLRKRIMTLEKALENRSTGHVLK